MGASAVELRKVIDPTFMHFIVLNRKPVLAKGRLLPTIWR
jgi:hypothetical protein